MFAQLVCFAQGQALRIEPANVNKEVVVDELDETYRDITQITVTNTSDKTIELVQEQVVGKKPGAWAYGTFSRRTSSAPYALPQDRVGREPVVLRSGETAAFALVLDSDGQTGSGTVGVIFSDIRTPGVTLGTANFTTRIVRRGAISNTTNRATTLRRPTPTTVSVYPNPARERFFVEVPGGTRLGRVIVANTLGKQVRKYDRPAGAEGYDINNLPDGLYLVSIYDDRGKKLKTLRLLHRRFGA